MKKINHSFSHDCTVKTVVSNVSQEAHEAFTEWFNHSGSAPQKPAPVPEAKFTERVANEMREKEYQVK